ncbi:MAG TPA: SCO family protein [Acidobacteriaceae bacterium]
MKGTMAETGRNPQQGQEREGRREPAGRTLLMVLTVVVAFCCGVAVGHAQVADYGQKQMGTPAEDAKPTVLTHVSVAQHLDRPLPLEAQFVDEAGRAVRLGDFFGGSRPAVLALVYYKCPVLCSEELNGLAGALKMVRFNPGRDFDVVVVSIDPSETPADAAAKKAAILKRYRRPGTEGGWHFLTGQQPAIAALAEATGFGYTRTAGPDGKMDQFAHASSIQLVTPAGVIAQYYMGVEYSPNDLRLGLVEASAGRIGSPVDEILTYCYRYDPAHNGHSLVIARIVQAACMATMLLLGGYMLINFRRDARAARLSPASYAGRHGNG